MSDLPAALAALQADLPRIKRTATGQAGTRRYKYPPYDKILAAVRPVLHKHGFLWRTAPTLAVLNGELRFVLHYELTHAAGFIDGDYPLREGADQQQGAAISYAKRYALVAVLDLQVEGEDSDAMDAPQRQQPVKARTTGPEHERLREGLHERTPEQPDAERGPLPDDANPWQGPPPDDGPTEELPGTIDPADRTKIMMRFGKMPRDKRLAEISRMVGREIESVNELSNVEGKQVARS